MAMQDPLYTAASALGAYMYEKPVVSSRFFPFGATSELMHGWVGEPDGYTSANSGQQTGGDLPNGPKHFED